MWFFCEYCQSVRPENISADCMLLFIPEPIVWLPSKKIQKQQRLAEIMGCVQFVLPVLLQRLFGRLSSGFASVAELRGGTSFARGRNCEGLCFQIAIQESYLLLQSGIGVYVQQMVGGDWKRYADQD